MAKNRVFYFAAVFFAFAFSMLYTSRVSAILLMVVLLYPIAAAALTAVQLAFLKAEFTESRIESEKNTRFEFGIAVSNGSPFPCAPMELICSLPDTDSGRFREKRVYISLPPFGSAKLSVDGKHLYRGCYSAKIKKISAVDPLRIIKLSRKYNKELVMVFLPRKLNFSEFSGGEIGEQNFTRPNPITAEKEDFSHVREYRMGDILQMIHWKLTAKQDELMIKQFDSINDRRAAVLCDLTGGEGDPLLIADTVIETAIAFVKAALDEGLHSQVDFGAINDRGGVYVANDDEFENFFELMSVLPHNGEYCGLPALLDNTEIESAAVLVLITAEISDDIIARARALSENSAVYLIYVNLTSRPTPKELYEEDFLFFNVRGAGEEALKLAAAMAVGSV